MIGGLLLLVSVAHAQAPDPSKDIWNTIESAAPAAPAAPPVVVEVLTDVAVARPGASLWLGVRLRLPAGWHVYWHNPGDSGQATWTQVQAPEGVEVGPARFPGPTRWTAPGDIRSFGYAGEAVLLHRVGVPAEASGDLPLVVQVGWLACREACFPGEATVEHSLATSAEATRSNGALDGWVARLPTPWSEAPGAVAGWTSPTEATFTLPGADVVAFYPYNETFERFAADRRRQNGSLVVELTQPGTVSGVLEVRTRGAIRYHEVSLPTPR